MPINISLFNKPQCFTKSAFDKNLNANASSRNPKTTFTVFNQPPDLGIECNHLGNMANNAKGSASANPNPPIPKLSCIAPPFVAKEPANKEPNIGPVQENETKAKVKAIKKIPKIFPTPALLSAPDEMLAGNVIS